LYLFFCREKEDICGKDFVSTFPQQIFAAVSFTAYEIFKYFYEEKSKVKELIDLSP